MRSLYTLLVILTVGIASAQERVGSFLTFFESNGQEFVHILSQDLNIDRETEYCYPSGHYDRDLFVTQYSGGRTTIEIENPYTSGQTFTWRGGVSYEITGNSDSFLNPFVFSTITPSYNKVLRIEGNSGFELPNLDLISCEVPQLTLNGNYQCNDVYYGLNQIRIGRHTFTSNGSTEDQQKIYRLSLLDERLFTGANSVSPYIRVIHAAELIVSFEVWNDGNKVGEVLVNNGANPGDAFCSSEFRSLIGQALTPHINAQSATQSSGWITTDAAFPAVYSHPDYNGWSYTITKVAGNRRYQVSGVGRQGQQLTVYGYPANGNAEDDRLIAFYGSIIDAHEAAQTAILNAINGG